LKTPELRVAVDARLRSGVAGGVESVVRGLASGLSRLDEDAPERYLFLAYDDSREWLEPTIGGPCSIISAGKRSPAPGAGSRPRSFVRRTLPGVYGALKSAPLLGRMRLPALPTTDGTI
jgi:hypothetical protein